MSDAVDDVAIVSFCDITGQSIYIYMLITTEGGTPEQAQMFLRLADGNVEGAVGLFLENGDLSAQQQQDAFTTPPTIPSNLHDPPGNHHVDDMGGWEDEVRAPIAPRRDVLIGDDDDMPMGHFGVYGRSMRTYLFMVSC